MRSTLDFDWTRCIILFAVVTYMSLKSQFHSEQLFKIPDTDITISVAKSRVIWYSQAFAYFNIYSLYTEFTCVSNNIDVLETHNAL